MRHDAMRLLVGQKPVTAKRKFWMGFKEAFESPRVF
jgi:hypothetical protein